ncbi:hypothetical protein B7494_g6451 [Chlorociboria aeruginascens]|nr:hypothetical protein B7494_g6451 [Chlorociboria aeruginascens]
MQSIAPAPVSQGMQNQEMSADNGILPLSTKIASPPMLSVADMTLAPLRTDLRAQLAAVINTSHSAPHGYNDGPASSSQSPHDHNIDPAIGGNHMMSTGGDSGGDDSLGDGRKGGKRELSQSKRAAQNRAAQMLVKKINELLALSILMSSIAESSLRKLHQRAFRQRKEGYIKKLEEQVRELHNLEDNYKSIQAENYSLREYIIHLQSRLIESQGEYPQPPPNVNLTHPHARHDQMEHVQRHEGAPIAPMAPMSLQASAARTLAAAGLNSGKHVDESYDHKRYKDNDDADEEIIRSQLQGTSDGLPTSMSM